MKHLILRAATLALIAGPALTQVPLFEKETLLDVSGTSTDKDMLGLSIAYDGLTLAAGAPTYLSNTGKVLVWTRQNGVFGVPIMLLAPVPTALNRFGDGVDVHGNRLIVGESFGDMFGSQRGAAHVWEWQGGNLVPLGSFGPPSGNGNLSFGFSVAIEGDRAIAGAWQEGISGVGAHAGAVYSYHYSAGQWIFDQRLEASNGTNSARFGWSLDLEGNTLAVGSMRHNVTALGDGAVHIYEQGGSWTESAYLIADPGSGDVGFGRSLALDGDRLVVGAVGNQADPGAIYLFEKIAGVWTKIRRWQLGMNTISNFGFSVDIEGGTIIVGAKGDRFATNHGEGIVWMLTEESPGVWSERARLVATENHADELGTAVALAGNEVVAGKPKAPFGSANNGEILHFLIDDSLGAPYCSAVANSSGNFGRTAAEGYDKVSLNHVQLVAYELPDDKLGYFLASETEASVTSPPGSQGTLCVGGKIVRMAGKGFVKESGAGGTFSVQLDLTELDKLTAVMAGDTWNFQAWHRDANPGSTSNFTLPVKVLFK